MNSNLFKRLFFMVLILSGGYFPAKSHPMPNSMVLLHVGDEEVIVELQLPIAELQLAVPFDLSGDTNEILANYSSPLHQYILDHISINSETNEPWTIQITQLDLEDLEESQYRELMVTMKCLPPPNSQLRSFELQYDAIVHQLVTHKILVMIEEDWNNGIHIESQQEVGMIQMQSKTGLVAPLKVNLGEGSIWRGFKSMVSFGMKHIQEGLDHILFLLTLLLVAPLMVWKEGWSDFQGFKYTFNRFLKISLAFTIGHSTTLLIGSFSDARVNTQTIEVLIAVSIIISALHCIKPIFYKKEMLIASLFGLIHGLAFSFSISAMQLNWQQKLLSILGFNLGIEIMQIVIMICFFPILLLSKWNYYKWLRISFSGITILISAAWVLERINGQDNLITSYLNTIFS